jgi:hypothetical protein
MSENVDTKTWALMGLGLVAAFSAYQMWSMQKKVEK